MNEPDGPNADTPLLPGHAINILHENFKRESDESILREPVEHWPAEVTANEHGKNKGITWWRWPLVPVGAVAAGTLGTAVALLANWFGMRFYGGYGTDGWAYLYWVPFMAALAFGYCYSKAASAIAPSGKTATGIVMTTIISTILLLCLAFIWWSKDYTFGDAMQRTINGLGTIAAAIAAVQQTHLENG